MHASFLHCNFALLIALDAFQLFFVTICAKISQKSVTIDDIVDIKELKKIFRTKNNVLVLFTSNPKETQNTIKIFDEAAQLVKGQATTIFIDCSHR